MQLTHSAENVTKLSLYVALLLLPGGSLGLLFLWWLNRRGGKSATGPAHVGLDAASGRRFEHRLFGHHGNPSWVRSASN